LCEYAVPTHLLPTERTTARVCVAHRYALAFKEQGYEELFVLKHVLESQVETLMQ
jgi:hypothetical protein